MSPFYRNRKIRNVRLQLLYVAIDEKKYSLKENYNFLGLKVSEILRKQYFKNQRMERRFK